MDWQQLVYALSPGLHPLLWDYSTDLDTSSGLDAGSVAQVVFQPEIRLELAAGPTSVQLILLGVPGAAYQIQVSTNLVGWEALAEVASTNNSMVSCDAGSATSRRFYRAMAANLPAVLKPFQPPTAKSRIP